MPAVTPQPTQSTMPASCNVTAWWNHTNGNTACHHSSDITACPSPLPITIVPNSFEGNVCSSDGECICPPLCTMSYNDFYNSTNSTFGKLCVLDLMPTSLLMEHIDVLLPAISNIVNLLLTSGVVLAQLKVVHACDSSSQETLPQSWRSQEL